MICIAILLSVLVGDSGNYDDGTIKGAVVRKAEVGRIVEVVPKVFVRVVR